jgi:hypothetical protein
MYGWDYSCQNGLVRIDRPPKIGATKIQILLDKKHLHFAFALP